VNNVEQGFARLSEVPPGEFFVCTYNGNFSETLEVDVAQVNKFLDIASFDGRVLLTESKIRKPQALPDGINTDGSVTGRGSLRWSQKIQVEDKGVNPYFQVEPDESGWVISVNGNLIQEDLVKKGIDARNMAEPFASKFRYYTSVGLRETLLKDKCTRLKDPFKYGRMFGSVPLVLNYGLVIVYPSLPQVIVTCIAFLGYGGMDFLHKKLEEAEGIWDPQISPGRWENHLSPKSRIAFDPYRITLKSDLDFLGLPFEIDRLTLAYGYLDWKKYTGNPLIRAAD